MSVRKFFLRLALFSIPFVGLVVLYIALDPFKVIRHYDSYYVPNKPSYISLNRDYISTQHWINHYPEKKYNSYILGNSRSMFYRIDDWKDLIGEPYEKCYHFDASGESLYGIERKMNFLVNKEKVPVKNALLVIDAELLNQTLNSEGHIFAKHPATSGASSLSFQMGSLQAFFDAKFFTSYLDFKISGKVKPYMKKEFLMDDRPFFYDPATNEIQQKVFEDVISKNPDDFYKPLQAVLYDRDSTHLQTSPAVIKEPQLKLVNSLAKMVSDNQINCKIVISPLYNQKKINPADLAILKEKFGENNVFDFSGINEFTKDKHNYYETSHYRPHVAAQIMKIVYGKQ